MRLAIVGLGFVFGFGGAALCDCCHEVKPPPCTCECRPPVEAMVNTRLDELPVEWHTTKAGEDVRLSEALTPTGAADPPKAADLSGDGLADYGADDNFPLLDPKCRGWDCARVGAHTTFANGDHQCRVETSHQALPYAWPRVPPEADGGCCALVAVPCKDYGPVLTPGVGETDD